MNRIKNNRLMNLINRYRIIIAFVVPLLILLVP